MPRLITRSRALVLFAGLLLTTWLAWDVPPQAAQGIFATNTPPAPASNQANTTNPLFATNTPSRAIPATDAPAVAPTATADSGPPASLFNYSLRQWLERDLVALAAEQVQALPSDDENRARALQATLYELQRRYPDAPSDAQQRRDLINAMLAAPVGAIDMRAVVRPLIEAELNRMPDASFFTVDAFDVRVTPANLDGRGPMDAVVQITAQDSEITLYDEFVLALGTQTGYRFPPSTYNLFAAPFDELEAVVLRQIADVNRDSLDEVVLRVADGQVNNRLVILGMRNDVAIELVPPGQEIRFGELLSWPNDDDSVSNPTLRLRVNQAEATLPDWPCTSQQTFEWRYERNFYRQLAADLNSRFVSQASLACDLLAQEPLFARSPDEAAALIEEALLDYGFEADGVQRALLSLAMLYALDGRLEDARNTALAAQPAGDVATWAAQQADAFLAASSVSSNTTLDICAAMAAASDVPACDLDALLGRLLDNVALQVDEDLDAQLAILDIPVADSVSVVEVGRAARTVLRFDLPGERWWAFVAQRDGTYAVEQSDIPDSRQTPQATANRLRVPDAAFNALFLDDDPAAALTIVENVRGNNPDRPFTADGLYLLALSYDLTAAREEARVTYYETWSRFPETIWGQLAAEHLQQR